MKKGKEERGHTHINLGTLGSSGMSPAALVAVARGDFSNAIVASTPGGIEAQEKEGQMNQAERQTLPKDMQGCTKKDFEALGFKFVGESEKIFWECEFPKGWTKRPTSHSMWSDLLDDKGRKRGGIFFKAAFYDFNAHIGLNSRYGVKSVSLDENYEEIYDRKTGDYHEGKQSAKEGFTRMEVIDDATGETVFKLAPLPKANWDRREEGLKRSHAIDEARDEAAAWLTKNFPDWKNPSAYWD